MENSQNVSATMVTTSSLDLNLNKEDLIDIIIDEQLTLREKELQHIAEVHKEKEEKYKALNEKELMTHVKPYLPKGFKESQYKLRHDSYYDKIYLESEEVSISISINKGFTASAELLKLRKDVDTNYKKTNERRQILEAEINDIQRSPKRLKARLLKQFLKGNKEGKQILELINNKEVSLLPASK